MAARPSASWAGQHDSRDWRSQRAIAILKACLELFDPVDEYAEAVATLTDLGIAHTNLGELDEAQGRFNEALVPTKAAGDTRRTGVVLINLGDLAAIRHDFDAAAELARAGFEAMVEAGDARSAANAQANLAIVELQRGNLEPAAQALAGALRVARLTTIATSRFTA